MHVTIKFCFLQIREKIYHLSFLYRGGDSRKTGESTALALAHETHAPDLVKLF